jgi:hypothetical protein
MSESAAYDLARQVIAAVLRPAHFFVGPGLVLEWRHDAGAESWEIFQGRLLDARQTRERRFLESWGIYQVADGNPSSEPILAVKLDPAAAQVHVVRAIHCHVWEGYDAGGNIFLSRETTRWGRELVASFALDDSATLKSKLAEALFRAVVGTSRLPLTSLEAPLPAFTLGQLAYFPSERTASGPSMGSFADLIDRAGTQTGLAAVKLLETLLRSTPAADLAALAERFRPPSLDLLRRLFEEVSLSPYTDFVEKTLTFLRLLSERGELAPADHVDFCSFLLRHLARHLTAYDLVQFHHLGANYPDALLLDAVLKRYLELAERHPESFSSRLRRRALRQGWLLRRQYEGHAVPAAPTSPGENARVLPPAFPRVPDEQIFQPHRRPRRLYADDPLPPHAGPNTQDILRQSIADLKQPAELRELGTALFIDRPLSMAQEPGEPDSTFLLSHVCFSRYLAGRRLDLLSRLGMIAEADLAARRQELAELLIRGLPLAPPRGPVVPGRVSLADTFRVADDFQVLHTTRRGVADFLTHYPLLELAPRLDVGFLTSGQPVVILRPDPGSDRLHIHDAEYRLRLELQIVPVAGAALPALREVQSRDILLPRSNRDIAAPSASEG